MLISNSRFEVEYCIRNHKKPKVESKEGQIFKCSLCTNGLELENELILFRKVLRCRER